MTRRRKVIVIITAAVLLCVVVVVAFFQGMFYANRKATIRMANDECFYTVHALRALKDPKQARVAVLFDARMDSAAQKLAEMCLRYPRDIQKDWLPFKFDIETGKVKGCFSRHVRLLILMVVTFVVMVWVQSHAWFHARSLSVYTRMFPSRRIRADSSPD